MGLTFLDVGAFCTIVIGVGADGSYRPGIYPIDEGPSRGATASSVPLL